ncbi:MAG: hypothetical protein Q7U04_09175 [Bacteriovorax sp.]|nr:hypothetical protein [Bacteriovorax sp.]
MNFLIKIEEAINRFIEGLLVKLKDMVPHFIFEFIAVILHLPATLKAIIQNQLPKLKNFFGELLSFFTQYTTMIRGHLVNILIYLRSEEFKKADKKSLLLTPFRFSKAHPFKAMMAAFSFVILMSAMTIMVKNAEKIASGTLSLRRPASNEAAEDDIYIEIKKHKFEIKPVAASGGGHGGGHGAGPAGGEAPEHELFLDIRIEASNPKEKVFLEYMEEMLDDSIEALELPVARLPLESDNQKQIETYMIKILNEDFKHLGRVLPIKNIQIKQVLESRPVYYRQAERMMSVSDINLQIFLEDTHRNRQVWLDFSVLASNRNIVLFLKAHEVEIKDHLTTNVEPVIPQLPVEEEGRLIIKDKLRNELNEYLEKNGIEGKILEIYIDYLMVS